MQQAMYSVLPESVPLGPPIAEGLPFTAPWLLAPMEGVTAPSFRGHVLGLHGPLHLGGAFTEFVRVVEGPVAYSEMQKHLGLARFPIPVGLQLMGRDLEGVRGSVANAVDLGVPVVDLNFGCPAKGALRGCAGAAALKDPAGLERMVRTAVEGAQGRRPVTAKIRAGYDHADDVEVLARAAEAGGAAMLTIHCRTRREGYCEEVHWSRITRAVEAVSIPVAGNGSAWDHPDLEGMRRETGCAFVMVGRGALKNPWIFSGKNVSTAEAATFLIEYFDTLRSLGAKPKGAAGRVKQLMNYWGAGELIQDEVERRSWMHMTDFEAFEARLREASGQGVAPGEAEIWLNRE